jgi:hypothetical protein
MTKSRQLHDRNVEARATRMTARRIAALASVAVVVAAAAFVVDSLRRSVAQLASTTTAFSVRVPAPRQRESMSRRP